MDSKQSVKGHDGRQYVGILALAVAAALALSPAARGDLNQGLVAYWSFDGGTAQDDSGNGHDGMVYGAIPCAGVSGEGLHFDGNLDYVRVPDSDALDLTTAFSVGAWFIAEATDGRAIVSRASDGEHYQYDVSIGTPYGVYGHSENGVGQYVRVQSGSGSIEMGQPYYAVYTYDGARFRLYLDGQLVDDVQSSVTPPSVHNFLYIGTITGQAWCFAGTIDEVRIYNRALSAEEVQELYLNTGLVAYLSFDEGSGTTVYDASGQGNHGTVHGATWVEGISGAALRFDGINDYVSVPDSASLDITKAITIAAWVKLDSFPTSSPANILAKFKSSPGWDGYSLKASSWGSVTDGIYMALMGPGWGSFAESCDGAIAIGRWHHAVGVYDGTKMRVYVDGAQNGVPTSETRDIPTNSHPLYIGSEFGQGQFNDGIIDEVRIYNRALSAAEVFQLYAQDAPDCNSNGIPDSQDIAAGTSWDWDDNGVPDECQDCQPNGYPDFIDIHYGHSADCNLNATPDECDIASGTSQDCNLNTTPDECDVAAGTSEDCNANGKPDECDISGGTSPDCNLNDIPDACDLAGGTTVDCNLNTTPDECDLAAGTSEDCNNNGIPDECDITAGTSQDCQSNGIPDECDVGPVWSQLTKLTASDAAADDWFGTPAIDGDTVVVGALWDDHDGVTNAGSAYVFVREADGWAQQAKLVPSDPGYDERFGSDVGIEGDTIVVGSYTDNHPYGTCCGSAYIFTRSGTLWTQRAKLTAPDGAPYDRFGASVAISGDTILVGANWDDSERGSAYVFVGSGSTWTQQAKLTAADGLTGDFFGYVALDGNTALVGASHDDYPGLTDAGSAYVFVRAGTAWTQQAKLTAQDAAAGNNYFGLSVSLDGDTAVVGAIGYDLPGYSDAGSAYVFVRSGTAWTQQAKLFASDPGGGDNFGYSTAVDGETAVIGALHDDTSAGVDAGSAYVFTRSDSAWTGRAKLTASDAAPDDHLGESAALQNGTAVFGAYHDDVGGAADTGSAYVFTLSTQSDCNANGVPDECDIAADTSQDCQSNGIPDECDLVAGTSLDLNSNGTPDECDAPLVGAVPADQGSLWRSAHNVIRLTFDRDIVAPAAGEILIQQMLDGGAFGPDLSADFAFSVENIDIGGGAMRPRVLKISETGATSVLTHRTWMAIRNAETPKSRNAETETPKSRNTETPKRGGWAGAADFEVQYVVQVGDVNGDGKVLASDLSAIFPKIPTAQAGDQERSDVNGDGKVLASDLSALFPHIPSAAVPKPGGHSADMVVIPGGSFQMGDPWNEGSPDELPVHTVYISPFYIDTYEVTNQQYADGLNWAYAQGGQITVTSGVVYKYGTGYPYCDTTSSYSYSGITWNGSTFGVVAGKENHPMVMVSWYGSVAYCNWRSAMEGKPLCYDLSTWACNFGVSGYRLPTEAEWEKAAGWDPAQGRHYRFGEHTDGCGYNCLDGHRANYLSSGDPFEPGSDPDTTPVGYYDGTTHGTYTTQNAQSYYGCYDLSGDVEEWCYDWYSSAYYSSSPSSDPTGPTSGSQRTARGGDWADNPRYARSARRNSNPPGNRLYHFGFRCASGTP